MSETINYFDSIYSPSGLYMIAITYASLLKKKVKRRKDEWIKIAIFWRLDEKHTCTISFCHFYFSLLLIS